MYKKPGFPEIGEFVICTVKDVQQHAVLMDLDEYSSKQGMLYTSEVSRKLIRALKVFFKKGRKMVCKVMDVDTAKGHINLSHRRVGAGQERSKKKEWSQEKNADDLLQVFAKQNKLKIEDVYAKISNNILSKYGDLFPVFLEAAKGDTSLILNSGADKKLAGRLVELIQKRIVIPIAEIKGTLVMQSSAPDGLEIIKKAALDAEAAAKKLNCDLEMRYLGAPRYKISLSCAERKEAERAFESVLSVIEKVIGKKGKVEFKRA